MPTRSTLDPANLSRAQGCLLGQLAGDALGSLVEFQSPQKIRRKYPHGVRELADGGTGNACRTASRRFGDVVKESGEK
jgi:ADP-ribosylglycohydrolase